MADTNPPLTAVVVSGTGDGRVVMPDKTVGVTADHYPNIVVTVITPLAAIAIRSARVYGQTLIGLLAAGGIGAASNTLPAHDFMALLKVCSGLSVASACVCALQNAVELLGKLDQKVPLLRG